jgi:hypothetical protein
MTSPAIKRSGGSHAFVLLGGRNLLKRLQAVQHDPKDEKLVFECLGSLGKRNDVQCVDRKGRQEKGSTHSMPNGL